MIQRRLVLDWKKQWPASFDFWPRMDPNMWLIVLVWLNAWLNVQGNHPITINSIRFNFNGCNREIVRRISSPWYRGRSFDLMMGPRLYFFIKSSSYGPHHLVMFLHKKTTNNKTRRRRSSSSSCRRWHISWTWTFCFYFSINIFEWRLSKTRNIGPDMGHDPIIHSKWNRST